MKPRAVMKNELIADIANAWRNARTVVVFTGAGMSNQQLTLCYAGSAFFNFEIIMRKNRNCRGEVKFNIQA